MQNDTDYQITFILTEVSSYEVSSCHLSIREMQNDTNYHITFILTEVSSYDLRIT